MNVLIDLSSGVSGDMVLGALLQMASPGPEWEAYVHRLESVASVMYPSRLDVRLDGQSDASALSVRVSWEAVRPKEVTAEMMLHYLDMGLKAVLANDRVSRRSRSMMLRLLQAEMAVHNTNDMSSLHLHETGTPDTLVDIVGASLLIDELELDGDWVMATPVSLGGGLVATEHGTFEVPVPAVRHMLRGIPARMGPVDGELATPTGMAVVLSMVDEWMDGGTLPRIARVLGRGAGSRTYIGHRNVLSLMEVS